MLKILSGIISFIEYNNPSPIDPIIKQVTNNIVPITNCSNKHLHLFFRLMLQKRFIVLVIYFKKSSIYLFITN